MLEHVLQSNQQVQVLLSCSVFNMFSQDSVHHLSAQTLALCFKYRLYFLLKPICSHDRTTTSWVVPNLVFREFVMSVIFEETVDGWFVMFQGLVHVWPNLPKLWYKNAGFLLFKKTDMSSCTE